MPLPHKISTLLYCFNAQDEVLLIERAQEPNQGCWSPPGGKLKTEIGESPFACACREAREEMGFNSQPNDWRLTGMVSEQGYQGQAHWLMFLFECQFLLPQAPPPNREGRFQFVARADLRQRQLPTYDGDFIWPAFWRHRGGFFSAHCRCHADGGNDWILEESRALPQIQNTQHPNTHLSRRSVGAKTEGMPNSENSNSRNEELG